jgi:hypothetical protein
MSVMVHLFRKHFFLKTKKNEPVVSKKKIGKQGDRDSVREKLILFFVWTGRYDEMTLHDYTSSEISSEPELYR